MKTILDKVEHKKKKKEENKDKRKAETRTVHY